VKNVIIAMLTVSVAFLLVGSIVLMKSADTARIVAAKSHADTHELLRLSARLEAANDICLDLMERQLKKREKAIEEVMHVRAGRYDEVRSGSGGTHKGGTGKRRTRSTSH
jgi:hypothetical protein